MNFSKVFESFRVGSWNRKFSKVSFVTLNSDIHIGDLNPIQSNPKIGEKSDFLKLKLSISFSKSKSFEKCRILTLRNVIDKSKSTRVAVVNLVKMKEVEQVKVNITSLR